MKGRMMVKWNWRKSRIIFLRENKHLVFIVFVTIKTVMTLQMTTTVGNFQNRKFKFMENFKADSYSVQLQPLQQSNCNILPALGYDCYRCWRNNSRS